MKQDICACISKLTLTLIPFHPGATTLWEIVNFRPSAIFTDIIKFPWARATKNTPRNLWTPSS